MAFSTCSPEAIGAKRSFLRQLGVEASEPMMLDALDGLPIPWILGASVQSLASGGHPDGRRENACFHSLPVRDDVACSPSAGVWSGLRSWQGRTDR